MRSGVFAAAACLMACTNTVFIEDDDDGGRGGSGPATAGTTVAAASSKSATVGSSSSGPVCTAEVCDGLDNDCDGSVDETDPNVGGACDTGIPGVCASGTLSCTGGALVCDQMVFPEFDSCDHLDNDCNGVIDPAPCMKVVFTTSTLYTGNLGGLGGADDICQAHADGAGLNGTFKAWLSTGSVSARDRLTHHGGPYRLVDGTIIALEWADLVDGQLSHAIDRTEWGGLPPQGSACDGLPFYGGPVWSDTTSLGVVYDPDYACDDWTSTSANTASLGAFDTVTFWSGACSWGFEKPPVCTGTAALFCFEQ